MSKKQNNVWNLEMFNGRQIILEVKRGKPLIETSYYAPEFGKRFNTQCLKVALDKTEGSYIKIKWDNLDE